MQDPKLLDYQALIKYLNPQLNNCYNIAHIIDYAESINVILKDSELDKVVFILDGLGYHGRWSTWGGWAE